MAQVSSAVSVTQMPLLVLAESRDFVSELVQQLCLQPENDHCSFGRWRITQRGALGRHGQAKDTISGALSRHGANRMPNKRNVPRSSRIVVAS